MSICATNDKSKKKINLPKKLPHSFANFRNFKYFTLNHEVKYELIS